MVTYDVFDKSVTFTLFLMRYIQSIYFFHVFFYFSLSLR